MGSASREEQWLSGQESPVKCVNCFDDKYLYSYGTCDSAH